MHAESPSVYHLPVHLQGQHMVYFNAEDELDSVMERETTKKTALTAFFEANREGLPEAKDTLYQDFPHKFVFDKKKKKWTVRKKGTAIGQMYFSVPSQGERFYLRTLLTVVKGPESFEDLRTYNGILYNTYKEACMAHCRMTMNGRSASQKQ